MSSDTASRPGHFSSAEEIAETHEVDCWVGPRSPLCAVWKKQSLSLLAIQSKLTLKWFLFCPYILFWYFLSIGGRDSSVGMATRYGLDGPGIESRWG